MVTCGTVEVIPAFDESDVEITDCETTPQEAVVNEDPVEATVEVSNDNDRPALVDVEFSSAGESVSEELEVGAQGSSSVTAEFVYEEAGTFDMEVEITSADAAE